MPQLYGYYRSSAAYRVRIALNLKGVEYRQVAVNLLSNEQRDPHYLALNPQGLIPSLQLEDGTVLTQSGAILEWLEETVPEPPLYPREAVARARCRAQCNAIACDIHPLNNLRVLRYLKEELGISDEQKIAWYQHWISLGFASLEQQLGDAPFALGDSASMVDVYLVPQVYNALRFNQDMSAFPSIQQVYRHCIEVPAFRSAAPEVQPDAPEVKT